MTMTSITMASIFTAMAQQLRLFHLVGETLVFFRILRKLSSMVFVVILICRAACAIQDYESTIITGGHETMDVVARYNLQVKKFKLYNQNICNFQGLSIIFTLSESR